MPTIAVDKEELLCALDHEYTVDEFDELCFEFGIELDEDTSAKGPLPVVNGIQERAQLKIEIPANRYDLLCFEGITLMLNIFKGKKGQDKIPDYKLSGVENPIQIHVDPSTTKIRPYVAGAVLRGITFTQERYDSFIALQDKLHQNLCRQRTLVSMGTHDLDKIKGPFTYEALAPEEIVFAPLNQTTVMTGSDIMTFYKDLYLGQYLKIIKDSPVYPVILDSGRNVCSLPPIINSDLSKITLDTRNVFIEITATDKTKMAIVLNILVAMFSEYSVEKYTVEPVEIISKHNEQSRITPDLSRRKTTAEVDYINQCCGLDLTPEEICKYLQKMAYVASPSTSDANILNVEIPVTRADILHQCDIMEDVAIAYGFNNLPRRFPGDHGTVGRPLKLNELSDTVRESTAMAGWTEVMPLILCSHDENFTFLQRKDDGQTAVKLANPKTAEYQVVRTSLLPGILKTLRENKGHPLPMKVFEVSDVAFKDQKQERGSRNERHFAAAWCGKESRFDQVHGLLDHVMKMLEFPFIQAGDNVVRGYWIAGLIETTTFLPARACGIYCRRKDGEPACIGSLGVLHPEVIKSFGIEVPVSAIELNLEALL